MLRLGTRLGAALSAARGRAMLVELYTCSSSTRLPWFRTPPSHAPQPSPPSPLRQRGGRVPFTGGD